MRKNKLTRQVRRAYSQDALTRICTLREDRFGRAFGMQTVKIEPKWKPWRSDRSELPAEDYYHYKDNGSSVLAVAHLDTVVSQKGRVPRFTDTKHGPAIQSGALDDRLGAYVILDLLPKLGLTCDWLLTVGEESGASTADYFDSHGKKYDWAIEFDRGGTDVVMYQYENGATCALVEAAGAQVGSGSFSDIAYLEQLGVKAFNWGVGYRGNYHSVDGYAFLDDTFSMVGKYLRFHEQNAGTVLPHDPGAKYGRGRSRDGYYDSWQDEDEYLDCINCGEKRVVDSVTWYCTFCGVCQDCGATDPDVAADWNDPDVDVCQCYAPKRLRDEAAQAGSEIVAVTTASPRKERDDWTGLSWDEYCALRPGPADDCEPVTKADVTPRISAAPPWSEHRPAVSHGLGFPTGQDKPGSTRSYGDRLRDERTALASRKAAGLSEDLLGAVKAYSEQERQAPASWHAAAKNGDLHIVEHIPGPGWATACLRCAARWPHPIAETDGGLAMHPSFEVPLAGGGFLVRAAHMAGGEGFFPVQGCPRCEEQIAANLALDEVSEADRGDGVLGLQSQEAADRYLNS